MLTALGAYNLVRALPRVTIARGVANGRRVAELERRLGIDIEESAQRLFLRRRLGMPLWNALYLGSQLVIMPLTLGLVYRYRRESWPFVRNLALISWSGGLSWYALQPTAPPRLVGGRTVDTVSQQTLVKLDSTLLRTTYNPVAAMPSLHVGMSFLAAWSLINLCDSGWTSVLGSVYPALVTVAVVVTGNHYVLDVAAGLGVAASALAIARRLTRPPGAASTWLVPRPGL